jgi:hypothetical protein
VVRFFSGIESGLLSLIGNYGITRIEFVDEQLFVFHDSEMANADMDAAIRLMDKEAGRYVESPLL